MSNEGGFQDAGVLDHPVADGKFVGPTTVVHNDPGPDAPRPKISIVTPSFNTGKFLEDTILSILNQSYKSFEHIVVDGGSTDGSVEILKKYPHIRWVSEKDEDCWEGLSRTFALARGEYIMNCCVSDGYLDKDWFQKCVDVLDNDKEVSLVWGRTRYMDENGKLGDILYKQFHDKTAPQKQNYFSYWLATCDPFPENNLCARKIVFDTCFPPYKKGYKGRMATEFDGWNEFVDNFHILGYLPYFIPSIANFGRIHSGQRSEVEQLTGTAKVRRDNFFNKMKEYRKSVLLGKVEHHFRDGDGNILPYRFSRSKFFREEIFSAYGMRRIALRISAATVRPVARKILASKTMPEGVKKAIRKLKIFYGVRQ